MKRTVITMLALTAVTALLTVEATAQYYRYSTGQVRLQSSQGSHHMQQPTYYQPQRPTYYQPQQQTYYQPQRPTYYQPQRPNIITPPTSINRPPFNVQQQQLNSGAQIASGILGIINGAMNARNSR